MNIQGYKKSVILLLLLFPEYKANQSDETATT